MSEVANQLDGNLIIWLPNIKPSVCIGRILCITKKCLFEFIRNGRNTGNILTSGKFDFKFYNSRSTPVFAWLVMEVFRLQNLILFSIHIAIKFYRIRTSDMIISDFKCRQINSKVPRNYLKKRYSLAFLSSSNFNSGLHSTILNSMPCVVKLEIL